MNEKAEANGKQTHEILDHQGMKFVRYVVFDESPLLMIIIRKGERGLTTG